MLIDKFTQEIMAPGLEYSVGESTGRTFSNLIFMGIDLKLNKPMFVFESKDKGLVLINLSYLTFVEENRVDTEIKDVQDEKSLVSSEALS